MIPQITWFRHSHENRNDLLRFGFMRLHYQGDISYRELPFEEISKYGFGNTVAALKDPRHISFIQYENGRTRIRCLVDAEDSFALITPLITEVDICFCSGYNSDFFEKKQFVQAYSWQKEADIHRYKQLIDSKLNSFGTHFNKIQKFIPIAPNQGSTIPISFLQKKYRNVEYKLNRLIGRGNNFSDTYKAFEAREQYLNELRNCELAYDIVLNDSLWGWPQHRINLHNRLKELQRKDYHIHSILNYVPPAEAEDVSYNDVRQSDFPMTTNHIHESYELMLAKSRLAVYACGFHWGWRNIMMLALRTGIPVVTDRLLTEAYFDMKEFKIFEQEDHQWQGLESYIDDLHKPKWEEYKKQNQAVYDKYMSPESVAGYFLRTIETN
jgi:hypothetical protein